MMIRPSTISRACPTIVVAALVAALTGGEVAAQQIQWATVPEAAEHKDLAQLQSLLLSGNVDPDAVGGESHRTGLDYAASFNDVPMSALLLQDGAHVNAPDNNGNTALYWAAERGNLAVMRFLIAHKATVDAANRVGVTPLMAAAQHNEPDAVRLLLMHGADPHKQDFTGRDAFGWAAGEPNVLAALSSVKLPPAYPAVAR